MLPTYSIDRNNVMFP